MEISQELEKAWQAHRARTALKGYDSPIGRTYARLLVSFERALTNGMREALTLSLTDKDFDWFCECILIDRYHSRLRRLELLPGIVILPEMPVYSHFMGHDKRGRLLHYPVMEDPEFFAAYVATDEELFGDEFELLPLRKAG
jgi:hypothetical protein